MTIFKGVLKEWTNSLSILVTHKTKATICRVSGLIRNVKRSSSIPFVLVLPQFIDNGRYPRWTTKTMVQLWRCLKELWRNWINLLLTIVTHMTKATICRLSRLIRNAKRSSSIHSFLFFFNLLNINRHRIGKSVSEYPFRIVFIRYRRCNNNNRVAASLVVVLATSCVGCIQLNHKYKTL